jgi:hypothetical protein
MKNDIFISIAAYKDPELVPTLVNCIENAKSPTNLHFTICWQYDENDEFNKDFEDLVKKEKKAKFNVIKVPHFESKGTCWARAEIQQHYKNEKYTLQLDSHHRFVKNWDTKCIKMYENLKANGSKKPLLTAYIPEYNPENDPAGRATSPWKLNFDRFIPEGAVFFLPASIDNHKKLKGPIRSRFLSAHFIFTQGKWVEEVPYDPNYFFHGEEISMAARSHTHGYDLYHPHIIVCHHEYTRKGRTKFWDDHTGVAKAEKLIDTDWAERNSDCHLRNRKLFEMDGLERDIDFGPYGFGTERTLEDYERYAGINFKKRGVQQYTLENKEPPGPAIDDPEEYENSFSSIFKHYIDVQKSTLAEGDYNCIVVAFEDKDGKELFRKDADEGEISSLFAQSDQAGNPHLAILREFQTVVVPYKAIIWPHSQSKGWTDRQEVIIPNGVS